MFGQKRKPALPKPETQDCIKTNKYQKRLKSINNTFIGILTARGFDFVIRRPRKVRVEKTVMCFDIDEIYKDGKRLFIFTDELKSKIDLRRRRALTLLIFEYLLRTQYFRGVVVTNENGQLPELPLNELFALFERFDDIEGLPYLLKSGVLGVIDSTIKWKKLSVTFRDIVVNDSNVIQLGCLSSSCMMDAVKKVDIGVDVHTFDVDFSLFNQFFIPRQSAFTRSPCLTARATAL